MKNVRYLLHLVDITNEWVGRIVSFFIIPLVGVIVVDAVLRYIFIMPAIWAFDTSLQLYAAYIILGGGYTLLYREHVNMDILYAHFSPSVKAIMDLFTGMLFFFFCGLLLWKGTEMALDSLRMWEHSTSAWGPPVYPIKICLPIGAFLILLQGLAKFIRDLTTVLTGKAEMGTGDGGSQ